MTSLKRSIWLSILFLGLLPAARAQLVFDPAEWDFGSIEETRGRVTHTFTGVNRGKEPVVILDVVTSCGCTVPEFSRKPVLPGARTEITVTFDPANRPGTFHKELGVYSSERKKIAALTIRGTVVPRPRSIEELYPVEAGRGLRFDATLCAFTYVYPGRETHATIGYANTSDRTVRIELIPQRESGLLTVACPAQIAPGERGQIDFGYLIPAEKPRYGTLNDVLEVFVDGRSTGTFLTAHGIGADDPSQTEQQTAPKVHITENMIKFGAVKHAGPVQRRPLTLTNTGGSELIVRAVENSGHVATTLAPGQRIAPGQTLTTEVLLDPSAQEFGVVTDHLVLVTNDPVRPMRRLRVTAIIED